MPPHMGRGMMPPMGRGMMPGPGRGQMLPGGIPGMQPQKIIRDRSQPIGKWSSVPPNNTIYVNNINEKLKREELMQSLRHVFGQFGKILDITCYTKILKAKGQAFIVFDKLESATKALTEMQNFMFYNKPIRVSYAKTKSDVIAKREGTYKQRQKRPREKKVKGEPSAKKPKTEAVPRVKKTNILIVSNLPQDANQTMVTMLFRKYPGFHSVTDPAHGQCQVKFDTDYNASRAMGAMQGFKFFNNVKLEISYGEAETPQVGGMRLVKNEQPQ